MDKIETIENFRGGNVNISIFQDVRRLALEAVVKLALPRTSYQPHPTKLSQAQDNRQECFDRHTTLSEGNFRQNFQT